MVKVGRKSVNRRTVTTPVRYVRLGESFTRSDEFKEEFIAGRCKCCGSREHSLLRVENLSRTRNGRTTYEYSCPVARHEDLYERNRYYPLDELNINFQFDTLKYAEVINFDIDTLCGKFVELYSSDDARLSGCTPATQGHLNRIWNELLETCRSHA